MVVVDRRRPCRSFHVGIEWLAVLALPRRSSRWRREPAPGLWSPRSRSWSSRAATGLAAIRRARACTRRQPRRASASISTSSARVDQRRRPRRASRPAGSRGRPRRGPRTTAGDVRDVGHEHPGPHDVGQGEARLGERALDDLEDRRAPGPRRRPGGASAPSGPASVVPATQHESPTTTRAAVAEARLPRPARRDATPSSPRSSAAPGAPRDASRQATTSGSAAIARSRPARSVVRGTIESTSRYSAGAWSLPPIGPEAVEARDAQPGRRVGVGRAAGRGVARPRTRAARRRPGRGRPAGRCARASPSATSGPSARSRRSCRGPRSRAAISPDRGLGGLERARAPSPGRRPRARTVRRRRWAASRRR